MEKIKALKEGNHLIATQRDNKDTAISFILVYIDKNGKEHPRKP